MRFTRWWNPSLPQTLAVAAMLLYVQAVFAFLGLMGIGLGGSAYVFLVFLFDTGTPNLNTLSSLALLATLGSALAYGFAALAIVNGQRIGWKVGLGVAIGAVILPLAAGGLGLVLSSSYVIGYLFDIALVAALAHPQSREYQKIWFE